MVPHRGVFALNQTKPITKRNEKVIFYYRMCNGAIRYDKLFKG